MTTLADVPTREEISLLASLTGGWLKLPLSIVRDVQLVELVSGDSVVDGVTREWLIVPDGEKLKAGDRVVVSPLSFASDGLEVREQQL